ncbi:hypothetical protein DENSPDRAFT_534025 [Dentipellis sp. KUC8613]|nr:hypothetical protein DENSPDRAFT_534025 [Dentipellis sp. KUC8613]
MLYRPRASPGIEVKVADRCSAVPMATPNSSPGPTAGSTAASSVLVRRRPKERPNGSLPIYSRPGAYRRPKSKRAVPTTYPVKGKTCGQGTEGLLKRHSDDEDDTELLNRSKALRHELREGAQDILDLWGDFPERASHLRQEMKDAREDAAKEREEFQEVMRRKADQIRKKIAEEREDSERKAIETRRIRKAQDQQRHQARTEYREFRREGRRAGLR